MESEDGRLAITFNGEIYNFRELRAQLERTGCRFRTGTDTEAILHACTVFGAEFLSKLEGMFAFGLWDRRERRLLLARDRTGIKPLFYVLYAGGLAFASEMKPLLQLPGFERNVNRRALRSAMRYASNIEDESMMAGIYKLRPGYVLLWKDGQARTEPYWIYPEPQPERWDEQALVHALRGRLMKVVRSHMISDAPLGAALSGGLDSSAVVAVMSKAEMGPVETFTVGHGNDDPDLINARLVAEHCRTNHHEIMVEADSAAELLPRVVWHLEEPLGQMEIIQMYANYREAAKFVKVLLVGEGADECFAGYPRYKLLHPSAPVPFGLGKDLYNRVYMYADEPPRTLLGRAIGGALWGTPVRSPMVDPWPRAPMPWLGDDPKLALNRALNHDQRTYLHHLALKRADALGMAHSLELRVPFLDRSVVEFANRVPPEFLFRRGMEKYVLRQAVARMLPPEIVWRRKRGFQMRLNLGLVQTLEHLAQRLLRPEDVRRRGFFDPEYISLLRRSRPRRKTPMAQRVWSFRMWAVLQAEVWARLFLDRPPSAGAPSGLAEIL
jgi:asparagine synthase (glutamine-hydrolysing)